MSFGDVAAGIQLAWYLWDRGFSMIARERNAHKLYIEFGREVKLLHDTLTSLRGIFENAGEDSRRVGDHIEQSQVFRSRDLETLRQICGNYTATLERCKRLLRRKEVFKYRGDVVSSIIWDLTVDSEVSYLRAQVHNHIVKIQSVLAPLEIQLISNLRQLVKDSHLDLVNRMGRNHYDITMRLDRLELLMLNGTPNGAEVELGQREAPLQLPGELEKIFSKGTISKSDFVDADSLSLGSWTGAFVTYFDESTIRFNPGPFLGNQVPPEQQYLNLMKCIWILTKMKAHSEYSSEQPGSLWHTYVQRLEVQLHKELDRFSSRWSEAERLCKPAPADIMRLDEKSFQIWLDDESNPMQRSSPEEDLMDTLCEFSLPVSDKSTEHRLKVLRSSAEALRIVDSITSISRSRTEKVIREYDINLARAQLIPLYAAPSSSPDALNIKFRDGIGASKDVSVSFRKLKDLVKFQNALTGYYVAFDKRDIQAECFYQQQMSSGSSVVGNGRLQIWVPKRLEQTSSRRSSEASMGTTSYGTEASNCTSGAESLSQSAAFSAAGSALPALSRASTFQTPSGLGHLHTKPKRPMLVLYLQDVKKSEADVSQQCSFLAIKIDHNTFINKQSCECRKEKKQCLDSSLEHRSGTLEASRYCVSTDLDAWNVAALGQWQEPSVDNHKVERGLKWVKITCSKLQDRLELTGAACGCKGRDSKASDDCNKLHRGTFGQIRMSYVQKLAEYNNRINLPHVVS